MIAIVDYGLGNVQAFLNVYRRLNISATAVKESAELTRAKKIILPGVGSFDHAMLSLTRSGMREALDHLVLQEKVPVLGVCVGMQMLGSASEEGDQTGLRWIEGRVRRFSAQTSEPEMRLPHMGWNDVRPRAGSLLFAKLETEAKFYFLHSYYFECENGGDVAAVSTYGNEFCAATNSANIYGVQFHPEKSHHFGMRLLQNFAEL